MQKWIGLAHLGRIVARQRRIVIREQGVIFGVQADDRDELLLQRCKRQALPMFLPSRALDAADLITILTVQHSDTRVVTSREHNPAHVARASAAAGLLCCAGLANGEGYGRSAANG